MAKKEVKKVFKPDNIIKKNICTQSLEDTRRFALYVNRTRSMPNLKDGLKPVHRRIIYAAYNDENCENIKVKTSKVVGTTIGKYHPHGDSSVSDAIKTMANWFEINYPLIDGHGNWGNFQGDGAAAMRYTEVKLDPFAMECVIGDLRHSRNVIDWIENYDSTTLEPENLCPKIPLLLVNGTFGIGYGLKVEVPPHNLNEVEDAVIALVKNPKAKIHLVPEQAMECDIIKTNFDAIAAKGNGSFKVRGRIENGTYRGKPALIIRSTPDRVYSDSIKNEIAKLMEDKQLPQVVEWQNDSTEFEMIHYVVLKPGSDAEYVKNILYKKTSMQATCSVNLEVLYNYNPTRLSYRDYLLMFIDMRKTTLFRLYTNLLQKTRTSKNEREAYIKLLSADESELDKVIRMIRRRTDNDNSYIMEYLIKNFGMNDIQAEFIMTRQVTQLSKGYLNKCIEEYNRLSAEEESLMNKIINEDVIEQEIIEEAKAIKAKYGRPRKCRIIDADDDIPSGEFKIVITQKNFIKKIQVNDGLGIRGDVVSHVLKVDNKENIILFDQQGRVFKLPVHKIPFSDKSSNGIDIRILIKKLTSNICTVMYEPAMKELMNLTRKYFVTILTAGGNIKKLDIDDVISAPPSGMIYIKMDDNDYVKDVSIIGEDVDIIVYSKNKALRMNMSDVPHQKKNTKGQRAMTETSVDGLSVIKPNTTDIIVITETGKINRFDVVALPPLGRNKAGSKVIKLGKTDSINTLFGVNISDVLSVVTSDSKMEIPIEEIPQGTSIAPGAKMIPLKNANIVKCRITKKRV